MSRLADYARALIALLLLALIGELAQLPMHRAIGQVPGNCPPNTVFAGPASGVTGKPAVCRALTAGDIVGLTAVGLAPQGRLTLTPATAVPSANVAAATTVFYTPSTGRLVPIWNGVAYVPTDIGASDLVNITTNSAVGNAGPAVVAANSNYDEFVWSNAGTPTLTRGPLWTSDTARGSGAGTTQLVMQNGFMVNAVAITNGPGAGLGTYVGSVRADGSATLNMYFGAAAAGGGTATLGVWNAYNQVLMRARVVDTNASWTYVSSTTRPADNSTAYRVNFISGLPVQAIQRTRYGTAVQVPAVAGALVGVGLALDSTTVYDNVATVSADAAVATAWTPSADMDYGPQIGFHYIQALEVSDGTHTATFYGQGGSAGIAGLLFAMLM